MLELTQRIEIQNCAVKRNQSQRMKMWDIPQGEMMPHFNLPELIIVLIIVVVLFGAGRVSKLGGELGTAIREFRKGLNDGEAKKDEPDDAKAEPQTK
jgi:sec-independent protein translocase protein TatA